MKKISLAGLVTVAVMLIMISSASALTIDTSSQWDSHINTGWLGSGQSLTVDTIENHFDSIGFYFDSASYGKIFNFTVSDSMNNGTTLFSTSFTVSSGLNIISIDQDMTANSIIYALIDYNGFNGKTAHFIYSNVYAGGNSSFGAINSQTAYSNCDHRFVAEFSNGGAPVPEPATFILLGSGLAGLAFYRRKRK